MLKKSFVNLHTKTALRKNVTKRGNIPFSQVKRVGMLHSYESQSQLEVIYHFFDKLEKNNVKVDVLILKDKSIELNVPEFMVIDHQDMTQLGKWNNEAVKDFYNTNFDYLLHLNLEGTHLAENILAQSKASCRVGKYFSQKEQYYELMIDPESNSMEKLIDQIYHYIQII